MGEVLVCLEDGQITRLRDLLGFAVNFLLACPQTSPGSSVGRAGDCKSQSRRRGSVHRRHSCMIRSRNLSNTIFSLSCNKSKMKMGANPIAPYDLA